MSGWMKENDWVNEGVDECMGMIEWKSEWIDEVMKYMKQWISDGFEGMKGRINGGWSY